MNAAGASDTGGNRRCVNPNRVLVIGGKGFFGNAVVSALSRLPKCEVWLGGRSVTGDRTVMIDLGNPGTFSAMESFDCVVNCASSVEVGPDEAIQYALRNDLFFVETTAEANTVERILFKTRRRNGNTQADCTGVVVLGMGIFPGLSNMCAAALHRQGCAQERLEVGIQLSPLSGAGANMRALMVEMMRSSAVQYEGGERMELSPFSPGPTLNFFDVQRATVCVLLPETTMLHMSTGVPNISATVAVTPRYLHTLLQACTRILLPKRVVRQLLLPLIQLALLIVRGVLLRWKVSPIQITTAGDAVVGKPFALRANDGLRAGGCAVAAAVALLADRERPPPGVYTPDELLNLEPVVELLKTLGGPSLDIELEGIECR